MKKIIGIVAAVLLALGVTLGLLVYGTAAQGRRDNQAAVGRLTGEVSGESVEALRTQENLAMWYNLNLKTQVDTKTLSKAYGGILNYGDHAMSCIEFPRAEISLPVYHGTVDETYAKGMTHMRQSAFPIGGKGNHSVLMGQAGLEDGSILFDVADLVTGDVFVLHTLRKTCVYRVDSVWDSPEKPACPEAEGDMDLCTLMIRDGDRWVVIRGAAERS